MIPIKNAGKSRRCGRHVRTAATYSTSQRSDSPWNYNQGSGSGSRGLHERRGVKAPFWVIGWGIAFSREHLHLP
jgi:hypothetical protein